MGSAATDGARDRHAEILLAKHLDPRVSRPTNSWLGWGTTTTRRASPTTSPSCSRTRSSWRPSPTCSSTWSACLTTVSFCNFNTVFKSKETEITNRTVFCTLIASRRRKLHCSTKENFLYLLNFIQSRKSSIKASEAGDFAQKADERIHTFPCNHLESRHPWASSCLLLLTSC